MGIHLVCALGDEGLTKSILEAGTDPNTQDSRGWTCLHFSVYFNQATVSEILLSNGADYLLTNNDHKTPLSLIGELMNTKYFEQTIPMIAFWRQELVEKRDDLIAGLKKLRSVAEYRYIITDFVYPTPPK